MTVLSPANALSFYLRDIDINSKGEIAIAGWFSSTFTLAGTTLRTKGRNDVLVGKLDATGKWLWVRSFGGTELDYAHTVSIDESGNITVGGQFGKSMTVGGKLLTAKHVDLFVVQYNSSGTVRWAVHGGSVGMDTVYASDTDAQGNVYIAGLHQYSFKLGTHSVTSQGGTSGFVARLDTKGNWSWVKVISSSSNDKAQDLKVDQNGNVYVAGAFGRSISSGTLKLTNRGRDDLFLVKYDNQGKLLWATAAGGTGFESEAHLALDNAGDVFFSGLTRSAVMKTEGGHSLSNARTTINNTFLAKVSSKKSWQWAKLLNPSNGGSIAVRGMAVDKAGQLWMAASFEYTLNTGWFKGKAVGSSDVFLVTADKNGNPVSAITGGGKSADLLRSIRYHQQQIFALGMVLSPFHFAGKTSGPTSPRYLGILLKAPAK